MGDYRSRSYGVDPGASKGYSSNGGGGQIQPYFTQQQPGISYAYSQPPAYTDGPGAYNGYKTGSYDGAVAKNQSSSSSSSKSWGINDAEVKRKKRVASYKVYTVEGKVKGSFRKGFRWLKDKYTKIVYGWRTKTGNCQNKSWTRSSIKDHLTGQKLKRRTKTGNCQNMIWTRSGIKVHLTNQKLKR